MTSVIVVVHEMDHDLLKTVPSALSGTATGVGYSKDAVTLLALAQYIRNLGYRAYASMNDTAASIPYAIKAGLGEYGRHGLLITEELDRAYESERCLPICRSVTTGRRGSV